MVSLSPAQTEAAVKLSLLSELLRTLSAARTAEAATASVLGAIGRHFGWQFGAFWLHNSESDELTCQVLWQDDPRRTGELARSWRHARSDAEGLARRAFDSQCALSEKVAGAPTSLARAETLAAAEVQTAYAFPVRGASVVFGVMEFLGCQPGAISDDAQAFLATLGRQLGEHLERQHANERLRASQAHLRSVLNSSLDALVAIDNRGMVIEWNPAAVRILGYDRSEALGRSLAELVIPERWREEYERALARHAVTGDRELLEDRRQLSVRCADGHQLPVEMTITRQEPSRPPRFTVYLRDLSAQQRLEAQLEMILRGVADGVLAIDAEQRIVFANDAAAAIFDTTPQQLLGAPSAQLLEHHRYCDEQGQELTAEQMPSSRVLAGESAVTQLIELTERDGKSRRWLRCKASGVDDPAGQLLMAIVILSDETQRREAEQQLRRSRDELELIMSGVADSITVTDPDGELIYANRAALEILGYESFEALKAAPPQQTWERLCLRDEYDLPLGVEDLPTSLVLGGQRCAQATIRYCDAQRGDRWALMRANALYDERGRLLMVLAISEDVTDSKEEELQLRHVAQALQASILPQRLPAVPGAQLGVAFVPQGGDYHQVGGDFYDVFALDDDSWLVAVGDVCGKGPEAAALTSLCRYTLRALSMSQSRLDQLLLGLNEAMIRHHADSEGRFATIALAAVRREGDGLHVRLCLGGHPPPYVLRRDGTVEQVGLPGLLVGVLQAPQIGTECELHLDAGESLVFYTDGVIEARNDTGEMFDLASFLTDASLEGAEAIAMGIERAVLDYQGENATDDVAVLVVRADEQPLLHERFDAVPQSAAATRRALERLGDACSATAIEQAKLCVTELATNAIKHSVGEREGWYELLVCRQANGRLRFSVTDSGEVFTPAAITAVAEDAVSGRGLMIVDALAADWGTEGVHGGSVVWFELEV